MFGIVENLSYLCSVLHNARAAKLANICGHLCCPNADIIAAPTPVRCVNAPAARAEWSTTGQRSRFPFLFTLLFNFHQMYSMKATTLNAAAAKAGRKSATLSATGRLALSLGLILLCALGALYCFARAGQTDAALWKLAALGCWLPALPAIFSGKGGAR